MEKAGIVLEGKSLSKVFPVGRGLFSSGKGRRYINAVDNIDFFIKKGEILGLAGESGSGKSTTGEMIVKLIDPTSGQLLLNGVDITTLKGKKLKEFRHKVQMIFQDPYGTLNPQMRIGKIIEEPLIIYGMKDHSERMKRVSEVLELAELLPVSKYIDRLPSELSGGERQRVAIARALVLKPEVLVADEPVSMLDVSIRAGILNLLKRLRDELGLAILYVSHDLSTIRCLCDRTAVMYLGKLVEVGPTDEVMDRPLHPYTKVLLASVPIPDPDYKRPTADMIDELPDQIDVGEGCRFAPRCMVKKEECMKKSPTRVFVSGEHCVACSLCENPKA